MACTSRAPIRTTVSRHHPRRCTASARGGYVQWMASPNRPNPSKPSPTDTAPMTITAKKGVRKLIGHSARFRSHAGHTSSASPATISTTRSAAGIACFTSGSALADIPGV